MATTLAARIEPACDPAKRRAVRAWAVLGLAHIPLVFFHAQALWARPHYQFFPMLLLGAAALAWRGAANRDSWQPGRARGCRVAVTACLLLYGVAVLLRSPWFGAVSALWTLAAAGYALGGTGLLKALAPAWVLLWLAIPPPLAIDEHLINGLQPLAVRLSSPLLDALRIDHMPAGNIVELPGRLLLVEEACSGVQSLFAVLACIVFYVLWTKRRLLPTGILILVAVGWVMLANVLRIVVVTYALVDLKIDLTTGWRHDAIGLIAFALAIGLTASTDCLFRFFTTGVQPEPELEPEMEPALIQEAERPTRPLADLARLCWVPSWPVVALFGVLGCAQCVWFVTRLSGTGWAELSARIHKLGADTLPERSADFQGRAFRSERRGPQDNNGEHSLLWRYDFGRHKAVVAVDFPFLGWHELPDCYRGLGWHVDNRQTLEKDAGTVVEVSLSKPNGRLGQLLFGLTKSAGQRVSSPGFTFPGRLQDRLASLTQLGEWITGPPDRGATTYQMQLFIELEGAFTDSERDAALSFFDSARRQIEAKIAETSR